MKNNHTIIKWLITNLVKYVLENMMNKQKRPRIISPNSLDHKISYNVRQIVCLKKEKQKWSKKRMSNKSVVKCAQRITNIEVSSADDKVNNNKIEKIDEWGK